MSTLYSSDNKRGWIYQPNYVRWRHRFRGPRESLKINQEISQFIYDATRVHTILDEANTQLEADVDVVLSGYSFDDIYDSSDVLVDLIGLDDLISRVEQARRRVNILRGSNG